MKNTQSFRKRNRRRNGSRVYISILVLALIIITAIIIIVRNNRENAKITATGAKIYFYDMQSETLKPEYRQLPKTDNAGKVKFVLEELSVGPKNNMNSASVPPDLIKSASISGTNVDVNVSSQYYGLGSKEEILCRAAIVYSLTDLRFVDSVSINIDGSELLKPNGQPFGKIRAIDIVMSPDVNPQGESTRTLTLYFADASNTGLIAETRAVSVNPNELVAKYIVQELINGPASDELLPTVPPETKLLKIDITDGVCSVDFSREFITRHTGAPGTELLSIYSVVNSLCEQSDIKNVLFLIEGKRQEQFKDEAGFNNLYEAKDMPPGELGQ